MTVLAQTDRWHTQPGGSFESSVAIVKSDVTVYNPPLQALYVGVTGDVSFVNRNGDAQVLKNAAVGWHFFVATKVMNATTATNILGWF